MTRSKVKRKNYRYEDLRAPKEVQPVNVQGYEREGDQGQREQVRPYVREQAKNVEKPSLTDRIFRKRKAQREATADAEQFLEYLGGKDGGN